MEQMPKKTREMLRLITKRAGGMTIDNIVLTQQSINGLIDVDFDNIRQLTFAGHNKTNTYVSRKYTEELRKTASQFNYLNYLLSKLNLDRLTPKAKDQILNEFKDMDDPNLKIAPEKITKKHVYKKLIVFYGTVFPPLDASLAKHISSKEGLGAEVSKEQVNNHLWYKNNNNEYNKDHPFKDNENRYYGQENFNYEEALNNMIKFDTSTNGVNTVLKLSRHEHDFNLGIRISHDNNGNELDFNFDNHISFQNLTNNNFDVFIDALKKECSHREPTNPPQVCYNVGSTKNAEFWREFSTQKPAIPLELRIFLRKKFRTIFANATKAKKEEFERLLHARLSQDMGGNVIAALTKTYVNSILATICDSRISLNQTEQNDFGSGTLAQKITLAKASIDALNPQIKNQNVFCDPDKLQKHSNRIAKHTNELFRIHTKPNLSADKKTELNRNHWFENAMSKDGRYNGLIYDQEHNPDAPFISYTTEKLNTEGQPMNIGTAKAANRHGDFIPKNERSRAYRTIMKARNKVLNPQFDRTATLPGGGVDNNKRNHFNLTAENYHKNSPNGANQKGDFVFRVTKADGSPVTNPKLDLKRHYIDVIARPILDNNLTEIELRTMSKRTVTIPLHSAQFPRGLDDIPEKWVMYAVFKGLKYPGKIIVGNPSDHKLLPGYTAANIEGGGRNSLGHKIDFLINHIAATYNPRPNVGRVCNHGMF